MSGAAMATRLHCVFTKIQRSQHVALLHRSLQAFDRCHGAGRKIKDGPNTLYIHSSWKLAGLFLPRSNTLKTVKIEQSAKSRQGGLAS